MISAYFEESTLFGVLSKLNSKVPESNIFLDIYKLKLERSTLHFFGVCSFLSVLHELCLIRGVLASLSFLKGFFTFRFNLS